MGVIGPWLYTMLKWNRWLFSRIQSYGSLSHWPCSITLYRWRLIPLSATPHSHSVLLSSWTTIVLQLGGRTPAPRCSMWHMAATQKLLYGGLPCLALQGAVVSTLLLVLDTTDGCMVRKLVLVSWRSLRWGNECYPDGQCLCHTLVILPSTQMSQLVRYEYWQRHRLYCGSGQGTSTLPEG